MRKYTGTFTAINGKTGDPVSFTVEGYASNPGNFRILQLAKKRLDMNAEDADIVNIAEVEE